MQAVIETIQRKGEGKGGGKGPRPPPGPPDAAVAKSKGKGFGTFSSNANYFPAGAVVCGGGRFKILESEERCSFWIDGLRWCSIEQFAEAMKFTDQSCRLTIQREGTTRRALDAARGNLLAARRDESYMPLDVLYVATHARFSQDALAKEALLSTLGKSLTSSRDGDWMRETVWMHWYIKVLRRVREELRQEAERDEAVLQKLKTEFAALEFNETEAAERVQGIAMEYMKLNEPLELLVNTMAGEVIPMEVKPLEDVYDLKDKLTAKLPGSEARSLILLADGETVLKDNATFLSLNLPQGTELTVLAKFGLGGGSMRNDDQRFELLTEIRETAARLRRGQEDNL